MGRHRGYGRYGAAVLVLVMWLAACGTTATGPIRLEPPDGDPAGASSTAGGIIITARQLTADETSVFLRDKGYSHLAEPLSALPVLIFGVTVDNGSGHDLLLEPRFITLTDGKGVYKTPLGYAQIYSSLPPGKARQRVLDDLHSVTFDRPVNITTGSAKQRLLLFTEPAEMENRAVMTFTGLYSGQDPGGMALDFVRVSTEE